MAQAPGGGGDQDGLLVDTVARLREHSPAARAVLDRAGVRPGDVRGVADLPALPITDKAALRSAGPLGWTGAPEAELVRVHASSGTTGARTFAVYTARDLDVWADLFARCYAYAGVGPDDRVQVSVGYGLWTAGAGFQAGAERLGALVVPVGPGQLDLQLELARALRSTVLCSTASFALLLAETVAGTGAGADGDGLALRRAVIGSERASRTTRDRIEAVLGVETFDVYGMTELWGPGVGIECAEHEGMHLWTDAYLVEVLDPVTLAPVPDGEVGELVFTTLRREGTPLLRYRSHDLSRVLPGGCACGSPYPRIGPLVGRTDDMVKIRGVAVYPAQLEPVLLAAAGATGEYQLHVARDAAGRDAALVRLEADDRPGVAAGLAAALRSAVGVGFDVEVVAPRTLPRSERKTRRVFDARPDAGVRP